MASINTPRHAESSLPLGTATALPPHKEAALSQLAPAATLPLLCTTAKPQLNLQRLFEERACRQGSAPPAIHASVAASTSPSAAQAGAAVAAQAPTSEGRRRRAQARRQRLAARRTQPQTAGVATMAAASRTGPPTGVTRSLAPVPEPRRPSHTWQRLAQRASSAVAVATRALPAAPICVAPNRRTMSLHPGFPQSGAVPTPQQAAQAKAQQTARNAQLQQQARVALQQAAAAHPALAGGGSLPASATPLSLSPMGYTYSKEQLAASGRLREGGVLDLSVMVLTPEQIESILQTVVTRVSSTPWPVRTYADITSSGPAVPSRSAPPHTLGQTVHMTQPTVTTEASASTAPAPANTVGPSRPRPPASSKTAAKPAVKAKASAQLAHAMQTRSAAAPQLAAAGPHVEAGEAAEAAAPDSPPPAALRTVSVQAKPALLPPSQWKVLARPMPLGKSIAYCKARGMRVDLDLMVPEELTGA
jgi:hypothetical protein